MSAAKWTPPTELIVSRELLLCVTTGQKVAEVNTEELESWKQCDRVAERLAESWNACRQMEDPAAEIERLKSQVSEFSEVAAKVLNKGWGVRTDGPSVEDIPTASAVAAARAALEDVQRVIDGRDDFTPGPRSAAAHAIQEALAQLPPGGA